MAPDPEDRPQSAWEVADELTRIACRSRRGWFRLFAVVMLLGVLGLMAAAPLMFRAMAPIDMASSNTEPPPPPPPSKPTTDLEGSANQRPPSPKPPPPTPGRDERPAVRWVLAAGGLVRVARDDGEVLTVGRPEEIPTKPFRTTFVFLEKRPGDPDVADADLDRLREFDGPAELYLYGHPAVSDAGLARLAALPGGGKLTKLGLRGPAVTDAGVKHLAGLGALDTLELIGCRGVTGVGFWSFPKTTVLRSLDLTGCPVTDVGLARMERLAGLRSLKLDAASVPAAAVARLAGQLPACRIESPYGTFGPPAAKP